MKINLSHGFAVFIIFYLLSIFIDLEIAHMLQRIGAWIFFSLIPMAVGIWVGWDLNNDAKGKE